MSRMKPYNCYGCIHLYSQSDAAGGGTYHCALHRLVIGEWGHWMKVSDRPKEIDGCWEYEPRKARHDDFEPVRALRCIDGGKKRG